MKNEKKLDAIDLLIESLYKPDIELRKHAIRDQCFEELMNYRNELIDYLNKKRLLIKKL